jgi:hypothetical protein
VFLKIINWITLTLFSSHRETAKIVVTRWLVFFVPVISLFVICASSYLFIYHHLTDMVLERRQAISRMAAFALEERFDRMVEVGNSLASSAHFRVLVRDQRWVEAIQMLSLIPPDYPYIERILLTNPRGILMADTPSLPGAAGEDLSSQDWYTGFSQNRVPYVSNIYQRTAEPRYNVIAVTVPVRETAGAISGILVLQVRLDTLYQWSREIRVGPQGFLYFVDPLGNVVGYSGHQPQDKIINFLSSPVVQRTLEGNENAQFMFGFRDDEKFLAAFASVSRYGWGVIVQESARSTFKGRNWTLGILLGIYTLFMTVNIFTACFIEKVFYILEKHRQQLKAARAEDISGQ